MKKIMGLTTVLALLAPLETHADFHIRSPSEIDFGELEIEHNGAALFDRNADKRGAQSYTIEFGTGLTNWWQSEIELGFNRDPGPNQSTLVDAIVTENTFMLTEPGQAFADFGFYVEYGQSLGTGRHAGPNALTFGPLIAKDIGRTTTTVNLFVTRELGPGQTTQGLDFTYAAQTRWNLWAPLSPAIEIYGDSGVIGSSPRFSQQQFRVGPVALGALRLRELGINKAGKIKYEIGWLFGATEATSQGALRWRLELEIPF
jgi:hypothetical protein